MFDINYSPYFFFFSSLIFKRIHQQRHAVIRSRSAEVNSMICCASKWCARSLKTLSGHVALVRHLVGA